MPIPSTPQSSVSARSIPEWLELTEQLVGGQVSVVILDKLQVTKVESRTQVDLQEVSTRVRPALPVLTRALPWQSESSLMLPISHNRQLSAVVMIEATVSPEQVFSLDALLKQLPGLLFEEAVVTVNIPIEISAALFEIKTVGIVILAATGQVIAINTTAARILTLNSAHFVGKPFMEFVTALPDDMEQPVARVVQQTKVASQVETVEVVSYLDGEPRYLEVSCQLLVAPNQILGKVLFWEDITVRKQAETDAQQSDSQLRSVLASIKEGITLSDTTGQYQIFNPEMERLTGFTQLEANTSPAFDACLHPDPEQRASALTALGCLKPGQKIGTTTKIKAKDGTVRELAVSTTLVYVDDYPWYLSAYHDITELKQAEAKLKLRNQQLEDLTKALSEAKAEVEAANQGLEVKVAEKTRDLQAKLEENAQLVRAIKEDPLPFVRVTANGEIIYANPSAKAMLAEGNSSKFVPDAWQLAIGQASKSQSRQVIEVELKSAWLSLLIVPVEDESYLNIYGRDITEEKQQTLSQQAFVSTVSHQIRTPITSLRWYSEMLSKLPLEASVLETVESIHQTAIHLASLVDDVLQLSRLDMGTTTLKLSHFSSQELVAEIAEELGGLLQQTQISLEYGSDFPDIDGDRGLIKEVLTNLISNAIKYSPSGSQVELLWSQSATAWTLEVRDHGLGIPESARPHIFKRFFRAQNVVDQDIDGTGLGLSLCKDVVERWGGTIRFESEEGKGTRFLFTVPKEVR